MYNVKVNGNYNVLINDINIYVSYSHVNGVDITKELHDSSKELKKLVKSGILQVSLTSAKETASAKTKVDDKKKEDHKEKVFIREAEVTTNPEDTFVALPKEEKVLEETKAVENEEILEVTEEVKVLSKTDTKETKSKKETKPSSNKKNTKTKNTKK